MRKIAIFVEGQTELIIVREMLLKAFQYEDIWVECFTLFVDSKFNPTEYEYKCERAANYFQVINVGNDQSVITRMIRRADYMWSQGFDKLIGLRDMYSKQYREEAMGLGIVPELNKKFIDGHKKTLPPGNVAFCFAIMETEAWILGMPICFERMDARLTTDYIHGNLGYDLNTVDPEIVFFHPAVEVEKIYELVGRSYSKRKGDIYAVASNLEREDFYALYIAPKCESFTFFCDSIPIFNTT